MTNLDVLGLVYHLFECSKHDVRVLRVAAVAPVPPRAVDYDRMARETEEKIRQRVEAIRRTREEFGTFGSVRTVEQQARDEFAQNVQPTRYARDEVDKLPPASHLAALVFGTMLRLDVLNRVWSWVVLVRWPGGMTKVAADLAGPDLHRLLAVVGRRARAAFCLETRDQVLDELVAAQSWSEAEEVGGIKRDKVRPRADDRGGPRRHV